MRRRTSLQKKAGGSKGIHARECRLATTEALASGLSFMLPKCARCPTHPGIRASAPLGTLWIGDLVAMSGSSDKIAEG
jgi:hypothetical protein